MNYTVLSYLTELEKEHHIRILYACEGGSRVWGFPKPDSDHDIRYIYVKSPLSYFSVKASREKESIFDKNSPFINSMGWDIRKALFLLGKGNPNLLEMLHVPSEFVYISEGDFLETARSLVPLYFSKKVSGMYYAGQLRQSVSKADIDKEKVPLKLYLYAIRHALCASWIVRGVSPVPPTNLKVLVKTKEISKGISHLGLVGIILGLIDSRESGVETVPNNLIINDFLKLELERYKENAVFVGEPLMNNTLVLDHLFFTLWFNTL